MLCWGGCCQTFSFSFSFPCLADHDYGLANNTLNVRNNRFRCVQTFLQLMYNERIFHRSTSILIRDMYAQYVVSFTTFFRVHFEEHLRVLCSTSSANELIEHFGIIS